MMADIPMSERATVDQTPDPQDIDRAPATERASKMPSIPGTAMDPKKMIGFAAAAGAIMFTVLALGTGLTGNSTLPPVKPKPALEPAQYDPASVIAPTLAGAATDPNAPIALGEQIVPAIGAGPGPSQIPPPVGQQARQPSQAEALREAARRSSLIAYGGERDSGSAGVRSSDYGNAASAGRQPSLPATNLDSLRQASTIGQAQARPLPQQFRTVSSAYPRPLTPSAPRGLGHPRSTPPTWALESQQDESSCTGFSSLAARNIVPQTSCGCGLRLWRRHKPLLQEYRQGQSVRTC